MATVVTLLSSDDDDDDIQFVCMKPAELGERTSTKREIKEEAPSKDDRKVMKTIFPTLISTSVTITKAERESPESPTDDRVNGEPLHEVATDSDDADDDIICLDKEVIPKVSKDSTIIKSESKGSNNLVCDKTSISTKPDVIFIDSDHEDVESIKTPNDVHDESTNDCAPCAPGWSETKSDETSDEQSDDSSSIKEVSGDEMSVQEITDDEKDDDNDIEAEGDNVGKEKEDAGSETDDSSSEIDKTMANEPSCSKVCEEVDKITLNGPGNVTEKLLNHLLTKISQVGYTEDNVNCVKRKIMKYYDSSPVEFTQSQEFVDRIKSVIADITRMMERPDSKDLATLSDISDKIKEFLTVFQRSSPHVNSKLTRLYKMYDKLQKRIKKLEEQDVESDDEYENPYVMLGRYEQRIALVYNKICELENKGNHADRNFKQEFVYTGINGVPVPIQRALEKYYNKTKLFPDFHDVWKLVKKVNDNDNLGMNKTQTYNVASTLFTDFGTKLKRRRQYDDFLCMKSWVREDAQAVTDPAQFDTTLQEKLVHNKLNRRSEEEVLNEFVLKEALHPAPTNPENAAEEEEEKDSELDKEDEGVAEPGKTFVDSDEEIAELEKVEELRRRTESDEGPPAKKGKIDDSEASVALRNSENESAEKRESDPSTKDGFLETCGLQPS